MSCFASNTVLAAIFASLVFPLPVECPTSNAPPLFTLMFVENFVPDDLQPRRTFWCLYQASGHIIWGHMFEEAEYV
jgi:hypothetical protein